MSSSGNAAKKARKGSEWPPTNRVLANPSGTRSERRAAKKLGIPEPRKDKS